MRRKLWTLGMFLLIVAVGLIGCSRQAQVREGQPSEQTPTTVVETMPESENVAPMPGETVVSAVPPTPVPNTPDTGEQSASSSAGQAQAPTAEPVASVEPATNPTATEAATAAATAAASAAEAAPTSQVSDSNEAGQTVVVHKVRKGETLSGIAQRYGTTTRAIVKANDISNPSIIIPGTMLKIQATGDSEASGCRKKHEVKKDEWVWQIARQYDVKPKEILAANNLTSKQAETLQPGTVLCIP